MATTPLPIVSVLNFTAYDSEAPEDLSDDSDATSIVVSSAEEANWWVRYDTAAPAGTIALRLDVSFNVISRDPTQPFITRVAIQDVFEEDPTSWNNARARLQVELPDGASDLILIVDQGWLTTPPAGGSVALTGDFDDFLGFLGTDYTVAVEGFDGNPYEVEVTRLVLSAVTAEEVAEINGDVTRARRAFTP